MQYFGTSNWHIYFREASRVSKYIPKVIRARPRRSYDYALMQRLLALCVAAALPANTWSSGASGALPWLAPLSLSDWAGLGWVNQVCVQKQPPCGYSFRDTRHHEPIRRDGCCASRSFCTWIDNLMPLLPALTTGTQTCNLRRRMFTRKFRKLHNCGFKWWGLLLVVSPERCAGTQTNALRDKTLPNSHLKCSFTLHSCHGYKTEESLKWDGYLAQENHLFSPFLFFYSLFLLCVFFFWSRARQEETHT